jgi:hypothetical protein
LYSYFLSTCELGAVHGAELLSGQAEHERGECVDLDERLPAVLVAAERGIHRPLGTDIAERRSGEVWVGPAVVLPGGVVELFPERGVVGGQAVEAEGAEQQRGVETRRAEALSYYN